MEISRNLSKQPSPTDSGRITLKNSLRDYVHLLKSPDFRLLVLKCAGSYSRVFTVLTLVQLQMNELLRFLSVAMEAMFTIAIM